MNQGVRVAGRPAITAHPEKASAIAGGSDNPPP